MTLFPDWGHLDRMAVVPEQQGRGFGLETLGLAVDTMRSRRGAARRAEHATHQQAIAAALRALRLPAHSRTRLSALRRLVPRGTPRWTARRRTRPTVRRSRARMKGNPASMGSSFGRIFRLTTWGESHGPALGVVVEGTPAGIPLTEEDIQLQLDRRRVGQSKVTSPRGEKDRARSSPVSSKIAPRAPRSR